MSSSKSQSDISAKSKSKKKSKKKPITESTELSPEEGNKNYVPDSPTSIGSTGSSSKKSLVKKLKLGKIYKKKKEQQLLEEGEKDKDSSAKTSLEEVIVQDEEVETESSTTASRDTEEDRSISPQVQTYQEPPLQQPEVIVTPIEDDPLKIQPEVLKEDIIQEEPKPPEQVEEQIETKEELAYQEKLKEINKAMQQVNQSSGGELKRECLYKILVIGELGAGKTSIIKRYVHQFFSQHYRATIGVDFALKVINWDSNTIIRLQLWDIAGQERFGNMTRVYYKEAVGAFIVFDVTRQATFDAVLKWKNDLDNKVQLPDGGPIPCVLLANKCDQQKEGIVNNANKMDEYCKEHQFSAWYETSAKENINIEEAAKTLVSQILSNDVSDNGKGFGNGKDNGKFPLNSNPDSSSDGRGCGC